MQRSKLILFFLFGMFLAACQTNPYVIEDSPLTVKDHRRIFLAVFGEPRVISQNGRELFTSFHDKQFKPIEEPDRVKMRYFTKVTILGNRRPYNVSVEVHREQRDPETKEFLDQGIVESLSATRLKEFESRLNQSRDKQVEAFDVENPF